MFYNGQFCYNSVEKIEIGLILDKNIRQFTAILLLGGTPLGIFAPHRTKARTERRSTVRAQPYYSSMFTVVSTVIRAAHFALSCMCDAVNLLGRI
jgi:hypothetical protein